LGREGIALNFLEVVSQFLADVYYFVQADQVAEICGGVEQMED
jgi:hypothetical protein